jgi:hypothetical protein
MAFKTISKGKGKPAAARPVARKGAAAKPGLRTGKMPMRAGPMGKMSSPMDPMAGPTANIKVPSKLPFQLKKGR